MRYDALIVTAGAGMGVDSGLPDFRGKEGFWKAYPVIKHLGLTFEEMANPYWFEHNPKLAWAFYGHRLNLYRATKPHVGFKRLLALGEKMKFGYGIVTSNVDGHFRKAGFDSDRIEELHGSINHFQCLNNCGKGIYLAPEKSIQIDKAKFEALEIPKCPSCGSTARPNILMFGDFGWDATRSNQQRNNLNDWLAKLKTENANPLIVEIGAGLDIPTIRLTTESLAKQFDCNYYRINPRDYQTTSKGVSIPKTGVTGIEELIKDFKYN